MRMRPSSPSFDFESETRRSALCTLRSALCSQVTPHADALLSSPGRRNPAGGFDAADARASGRR
jgi:hypothetical protein